MSEISKSITKIGMFVAFIPFICGCQMKPRNVVLTGYWPPSNQMIVDFSTDNQLNPDGWQGNNWKGLGYNVYAFFPTFPGGTQSNPKGIGDFEVDYQDTLTDFQRVVDEYKPIAIICYGMGQGPWEIEQNAVVHTQWCDDYLPPTRPDTNWIRKVLPNGIGRSTLPTDAIAETVNGAGLDITAWVDKEGDPGDFLCNYIACLATAYKKEHDNPLQRDYCAMAGFIHVGPDVTLEQAKQAQEITLQTTLRQLMRLNPVGKQLTCD